MKNTTHDSKVNPILRAARDYEAHGLVLVPVDPGSKRPLLRGWQRPENQGPIPDGWSGNIGIAHVGSRACAVDIDALARAREWLLLEHGVSLDGLLEATDAVQIISGRDNKAKLLFALDEPLLTVKYVEAGQTIVEFRSMTRKGYSVQDVLPPSIHPDTQEPYRWGGKGTWKKLPSLPDELREVWLKLIEARGSRDAHDESHAAPARSYDWSAETWIEALSHVDPNVDYDTWIKIGMAAQAAGLSFEDWDDWSSRGDTYPGSEALRGHWESFEDQGGITAGTLYHIASESGWEPPRPIQPSIDEMFPADLEAVDATAARPLGPTLESVQAEIDALSPGDEVMNLLRRLAMIDKVRESETVAKRYCDDIAERVSSSRTAVLSDYRKIRRQYHRTAAENRKTLNPRTTRRLEAALNALSAPLSSDPQSQQDIVSRYIFMSGGIHEGKFYDRVARSFVSPATFNLLHSPLVAELTDGEGTTSPSAFFVPRMLNCDATQYAPGTEAPLLEGDYENLILNTWRDTGAKPGPGDPAPWVEHLRWLVPNDLERAHLLRWFAFLIRHQGVKINHQVILGGAARIGKDTLLLPVTAAIGPGNVSAVKPEQLAEPYHDWALDTKLAVFNELMGSGMGHQRLENMLKPFAAAPPHELSLRLFGRSAGYSQTNLIQVIATTNHRDAFNFSDSKERWFALWCDPSEPREARYYERLHTWLEEQGGIGAVLRYLHSVDLSRFNPKGCAPATEWQSQLVEQGLAGDAVTSVLREMLELRIDPFDKPVFKLREVIEALQLQLLNDPVERKRVTRPRVIAALYGLHCGHSGDLKTRKIDGESRKIALWCRPEIRKTFSNGGNNADWEKYL